VASGKYTTGAVTVAAIPSSYVKPSATKAATTYTPSTSNQTIAAGTYCSGAQTIKGDANLKAENIASGVSIFGITGAHSGAEDLNTELTTQEGLISQLSAILDSKASGGASVEILTGIIYGNSGLGDVPDVHAYYMDETLTLQHIIVPAREEATIRVAANTLITFNFGSGLGYEIDGTNINTVTSSGAVLPTADGFTING